MIWARASYVPPWQLKQTSFETYGSDGEGSSLTTSCSEPDWEASSFGSDAAGEHAAQHIIVMHASAKLKMGTAIFLIMATLPSRHAWRHRSRRWPRDPLIPTEYMPPEVFPPAYKPSMTLPSVSRTWQFSLTIRPETVTRRSALVVIA